MVFLSRMRRVGRVFGSFFRPNVSEDAQERSVRRPKSAKITVSATPLGTWWAEFCSDESNFGSRAVARNSCEALPRQTLPDRPDNDENVEFPRPGRR